MKIDGLASGLETAKIIDALMDVAAIPKKQIAARIVDRNSVITNLQSLNASLQELFAKAKTAAAPGSLAAFTAASSSENVTVATRSGATAFSTSIVVDRVATAHSIVTAAGGTDAFGGTFTLVVADGTSTEITPAGTSARDLAAAINAAGAGITASVVSAGTDAAGAPLSRIQLTAVETGAASTFTLQRGTAADVAAGTATDMTAEAGAAVITTGADASLRLFAGTAAEQTLTSASNTFTGIAEGIDVTVRVAGPEPVTISVTADPKAQAATAEAFITQIAGILTRIDNGSKATVGEAGKATTLGVFTGDSTVRALRGALAGAVQSPVDGVSPSSIGISVDRHGALTFDPEAFATAMAADPAGTQERFAAVAARVEQVTGRFSDKYEGMLTQRITGQQAEVKTLENQVQRWDLRLEQRRATLERTYAALEVQLSSLQSQSSWLTSQLDALTPAKS